MADPGDDVCSDRLGLVGGHLDEGEDVETAAYRELAEETGVVLPAGALLRWREFEVFHTAYAAVARVVVFVAAADLADADIVVGEGRQIVFVEPGEARTRELTESATIALPAFLDSALYASMAP